MRKKYLIFILIIAAIVTALIIVKRNYALSPEYNYITAKLDIRNNNCKIVSVGEHAFSANDSVIQVIASRYRFTNVYIEKPTSNERKGINNYNEIIEIFLDVRNGPNWKARYQNEVDSVLGGAVTAPVKK